MFSSFFDGGRYSRPSNIGLPTPRWSMRFSQRISDAPIFIPPILSTTDEIDISMSKNNSTNSKIFTIEENETHEIQQSSTVQEKGKLQKIHQAVSAQYGVPVSVPDPNSILNELDMFLTNNPDKCKPVNVKLEEKELDLTVKVKIQPNIFDQNIISAFPINIKQQTVQEQSKYLLDRAVKTQNVVVPVQNMNMFASAIPMNAFQPISVYDTFMNMNHVPVMNNMNNFPPMVNFNQDTFIAQNNPVSRKRVLKMKACTHCHQIKKKCIRQANNETCQNCKKKGLHCVSRIDGRSQKRKRVKRNERK